MGVPKIHMLNKVKSHFLQGHLTEEQKTRILDYINAIKDKHFSCTISADVASRMENVNIENKEPTKRNKAD